MVIKKYKVRMSGYKAYGKFKNKKEVQDFGKWMKDRGKIKSYRIKKLPYNMGYALFTK